ncbi:hypothetical protein QQ045_030016 [Rhodiola kirilowii]
MMIFLLIILPWKLLMTKSTNIHVEEIGLSTEHMGTYTAMVIVENEHELGLETSLQRNDQSSNGTNENKHLAIKGMLAQERQHSRQNFYRQKLVKKGFIEKAEEMMAEIRSKGILPDVVTYNSFIYFWCHVVEMDKAKNTFFEMKEQGVYPDVVTYSTLIHGFCRAGELEEARYMFEEMKNYDISPNVEQLRILL